MDCQGRPSFELLQSGSPLPDGWRFGYYAFDLLNVNGRDLTRWPLSERRFRLEDLIAGSGIRFSPTLKGSAEDVVRVVRQYQLEGVVAKRSDSCYREGTRSAAWVKLPLYQRELSAWRP